MKQNEFYEVDGCTDFIPVKLIEEHKHMTNTLEVELTQTGYKTFVPIIYSFQKVNEPQKVVVPKFVADFYESIKDNFESKVYELCLQYYRGNGGLSSELKEWFTWGKNEPIQTLVKMKLYGYEIEQEKLYTVEIPNPNLNAHTVLQKTEKGVVLISVTNARWRGWESSKLTESEIKQDFDFLWQWAKEVEDMK